MLSAWKLGILGTGLSFCTLPVLGAVTPAAALGLGVAVTAAFSLMLLPVSVNYQVPATTAAGSAPGSLSFKRLRKEQGGISSALCWAGLSWGWGLALRPLLCSRGGKGVFVIKPEDFP